MGTRKWTEDYFAGRLKIEREHRKWTQRQMAELLSAKMGYSVHWTTIAKIEKGERSVRIDEAGGIADLFGASVDELLGRSHKPPDHYRISYPIRAIVDGARKALPALETILDMLGRDSHVLELAALEFEGQDVLMTDLLQAYSAVEDTKSAVTKVAAFEMPGNIQFFDAFINMAAAVQADWSPGTSKTTHDET